MAGPGCRAKLIAGDIELRLVAASILALSDRNAEAYSIANELLREPDHAVGIAGGCAAHRRWRRRLRRSPGTDPPELIPRWPGLGDPGGTPLYTMTCLNARALRRAASRATPRRCAN
jgi:hypothetical protein